MIVRRIETRGQDSLRIDLELVGDVEADTATAFALMQAWSTETVVDLAVIVNPDFVRDDETDEVADTNPPPARPDYRPPAQL